MYYVPDGVGNLNWKYIPLNRKPIVYSCLFSCAKMKMVTEATDAVF